MDTYMFFLLLCLTIGIILLVGAIIDNKKNMKRKKSYLDF